MAPSLVDTVREVGRVLLVNVFGGILCGTSIGFIPVYLVVHSALRNCDAYTDVANCPSDYCIVHTRPNSTATCAFPLVEWWPGVEVVPCSTFRSKDWCLSYPCLDCEWSPSNVADAPCITPHGYTDLQTGLLAGAVMFGAILGSVFAGKLPHIVGPLRAAVVLAAIAIVFNLLTFLSNVLDSFPVLVASRVGVGLSVGLAQVLCPLIVNNAVRVQLRGFTSAVFQASYLLGVTMPTTVGATFGAQSISGPNLSTSGVTVVCGLLLAFPISAAVALGAVAMLEHNKENDAAAAIPRPAVHDTTRTKQNQDEEPATTAEQAHTYVAFQQLLLPATCVKGGANVVHDGTDFLDQSDDAASDISMKEIPVATPLTTLSASSDGGEEETPSTAKLAPPAPSGCALVGILLRTPAFRRSVLTAVVLTSAQQLTGINAVLTYAPEITHSTLGIEGLTGLCLVTWWNLTWTLISLPFARRLPKRRLYLTGLACVSVFMSLAGIFTLPAIGDDGQNNVHKVISGLGLALFIASFQFGLGSVFWALAAENFSKPDAPPQDAPSRRTDTVSQLRLPSGHQRPKKRRSLPPSVDEGGATACTTTSPAFIPAASSTSSAQPTLNEPLLEEGTAETNPNEVDFCGPNHEDPAERRRQHWQYMSNADRKFIGLSITNTLQQTCSMLLIFNFPTVTTAMAGDRGKRQGLAGAMFLFAGIAAVAGILLNRLLDAPTEGTAAPSGVAPTVADEGDDADGDGWLLVDVPGVLC